MWWLLLAQLAQTPDALEIWLNARAEESFLARDRAVAAIDTRDKMLARQAYVREALPLRVLPRQSKPSATVTRRVERAGYTIENLMITREGGYRISANLYMPQVRVGRIPAILGVAGHSVNGKASATYQKAWVGFVRQGWAVLAYDPPGQGERLEYFDEDLGKSKVGAGVAEHNMAGVPSLLTGRPLAQFFVDDGVAAIDYLLTRPEIDPERIGVAGNSGGGTQASYLAAVEPRLKAAVSSCYMTSWKQLWGGPGPQDAEQILPGFLEKGLDFADFAYAFAQRPFLITSAIRDYFPIVGARAAHAEMKRLSNLLDQPTRAGFFEYDDPHGWSQPRREAAVRWFARYFDNRETEGREAPSDSEEESILYAAPEGRVGGPTVADWNRAQARALEVKWAPPTRQKLEALLRMPAPELGKNLIVPGTRAGKTWIVVAASQVDNPVGQELVASGHTVEVVVPRGANANAGRGSSGYGYDYQLAARAWLLGRNVPGMQTADLLSAIRKRTSEGFRVWLYAQGALAPAAVFAAALEPGVERVVLDGAIGSYRDVVDARVQVGQALSVVPGILEHFDLPQLRGLSEAEFLEINPRAPNGSLVERKGARRRGEDWPLRRVLPEWFL